MIGEFFLVFLINVLRDIETEFPQIKVGKEIDLLSIFQTFLHFFLPNNLNCATNIILLGFFFLVIE